MGYRNDGIELNKFIFGWGTEDTVNKMPTSEVNFGSGGFKISNKRVRAVLRDSFMLCSGTSDIAGFKDNGANILLNRFALVNRFIVSASARYYISGSTSNKVPIYYKGGGSIDNLGTLFLGGSVPSTASTVISNCPSVIMLAFQGAGGNGGEEQHEYTDFVLGERWASAGGGGGGSGGFASYMLDLGYSLSTRLVGYYQIFNGVSSFYKSNGTLVCSANRGGNGGNGKAVTHFFESNEEVGGSGGSGGSVSYYSVSPPIYEFMYLNERATYKKVSGADGKKGGVGSSGYGEISGGNNYNGFDRVIYMNASNALHWKHGDLLSVSNLNSESMKYWVNYYLGCGPGAGCFLGSGKDISSLLLSTTGYGYGGTGAVYHFSTGIAGQDNIKVSAGAGGPACMAIFW